jgi:hypothetical protein
MLAILAVKNGSVSAKTVVIVHDFIYFCAEVRRTEEMTGQ